MAEEQGRATGAGRPALNIERIYETTVTAEEIAQALADHFRAQEFEAQVYRTSENRTVMQARKESLGAVIYWVGTDNARGVAFASSRGFLPTEHRRPMNPNSSDTESEEEAAFVYPVGADETSIPSDVLDARH